MQVVKKSTQNLFCTIIRFSQLSIPYLARASMKSSTSGTIINVNGPDTTLDPGAALVHRLCQGGKLRSISFEV